MADLGYSPQETLGVAPGPGMDRALEWEAGNTVALDLLLFARDQRRVRFTQIRDRLVERYGIDTSRAHRDATAFVADAQLKGYISYCPESSWQVLWTVGLRQLSTAWKRMFLGNWTASSSLPRRMSFAPSIATLCKLVALVSLPSVTVVLVFAAAALIIFGLADPEAGVSDLIPFFASLVAVFLASHLVCSMAHEVAHFRASQRVQVPIHAVFYDRFVLGIQRTSGTPAQDLYISMKGPLSGITAGLCATAASAGMAYAGVSTALLTPGQGTLMTIAAAVPIFGQVVALLPGTADGDLIAQSLSAPVEDAHA